MNRLIELKFLSFGFFIGFFLKYFVHLLLFGLVLFFLVMLVVIWANIDCCYLSFFLNKKNGLRIMFGGRINFEVILRS